MELARCQLGSSDTLPENLMVEAFQQKRASPHPQRVSLHQWDALEE
ncbi:MAG: hypothetical protein F6K14_34590 [Symploca sp. SIO2C1]|nr:hypothetical protein [Symploca sp. SIO2C1]